MWLLKSALIFLQNVSNGTVVCRSYRKHAARSSRCTALRCVVITPLFPHIDQWKSVSRLELGEKANQRKSVGRGKQIGQSFYVELPLHSYGLCSSCSSGSLRNTRVRNEVRKEHEVKWLMLQPNFFSAVLKVDSIIYFTDFITNIVSL